MTNTKGQRYQFTHDSHKMIMERMPLIENDFKKKKNSILLPTFRTYSNPYRNVKETSFAYVTILFLGEKYIPSALTLAMSLRNAKVEQNIICMVQDKSYKFGGKVYGGVSQEGIQQLLKIFDVVIGCDLLEIENYQPPSNHFTKNSHYQNIHFYVTKLNVLGITNYKKIFYMDASSIVHTNIDSVFSKYDKSSFFEDEEYIFSKVGLRGTFFLLVPSITFFQKAIYLIQNYNIYFKNLYFCRGVDEVILFYSIYPNWSKKYLDLDWMCDGNTTEPKRKKCDIIYFQILKPFEPITNQPQHIVQRYYQNYQIWDDIVKILLIQFPQFKDYFKHISHFRNATFF
jgi:hypothetical protein